MSPFKSTGIITGRGLEKGRNAHGSPGRGRKWWVIGKAGRMQEFVAERGMSSRLFLARLDCISVLASDYLYFGCSDELIRLHLEYRFFDNKGPDIVAKSIGV